MIHKLIHTLLLRRHFWRYATFSEVAELYAARILRVAALYLAAGFISIYLYQQGYSVVAIALLWTFFYGFKIIAALPLAALVARIGPKHGVMVANILYIPAMIGFALLPEWGTWVLFPVLIFEGLSSSLYVISHNVDFSKVKSVAHAGKEIAYMNIVEKITSGLSPVIGGLIAYFAGPQIVILFAAVLFLVAALPLMLTDEPVKRHRPLGLKTFPWKLLRRHALAQFGTGFDLYVSASAWSLFLAVSVLHEQSGGNDIYLFAGILSSVVIVVSIVVSYIYGRLIDGARGAYLMRYAVLANSMTHISRAFVGSPVAAAAVNVANEVATTGFGMPYTRAMYDNADLSGHRIAYAGLADLLSSAGAASAALTLAGLAALFSEASSLKYLFLLAAAVVLVGLTARFPLYRHTS